ncbi:hypothetical protein IPG41_02530 [Candidatus Peregrinibacteria bacterium]|nr:MAG: hypothetical protein IPG41_02530 [Candidatus Peregrinibacteria bacterium]
MEIAGHENAVESENTLDLGSLTGRVNHFRDHTDRSKAQPLAKALLEALKSNPQNTRLASLISQFLFVCRTYAYDQPIKVAEEREKTNLAPILAELNATMKTLHGEQSPSSVQTQAAQEVTATLNEESQATA